MKYKLISLLILSIILLPSVLSATVTLDKTNYALTETASATMTCSGNEKNQAYTINWTNSTGTQIELDLGNTGDCTTFLQSFIINSSYISAYGSVLNVTILGTNLEGTDNASVSTAGANTLLISSISHQGTFLGLSSSIDSNVDDENGRAISGGFCDVNVEDPSNNQVLHTVRSTMIDGNLDFIWPLEYEQFRENKDYIAKISCFCGSWGGVYECIDSAGTSVNSSIGSSDVSFRTSTWIDFHQDPLNTTFLNGTFNPDQKLFAGFNTIYFTSNVSNNNPDNEPLEVFLRTFLVNEGTGRIFGIPNQGQSGTGFAGLAVGNTSAVASHLISQDAVTGIYHITSVYDVIYRNLFQVAQYIKQTQTFNITSVQDTFVIINVTMDDFFGNRVTTNASTQSTTSLPISNETDNIIVLSEGFLFDLCINATNKRSDGDTVVYIHDLILENPTTGFSRDIINEEILQNVETLIYEENVNKTRACFSKLIPDPVSSHSDYRFHYEIHIGTTDEEFECGEACDFEGETDFFYIGKDEDMIPFTKFHATPTTTDLGNPGVYIMTERGEYLRMFDDVNYTSQEDIDWANDTQICNKKDDVTTTFLCDYTVRPSAGERIKVCMEVRSFYSSEVFVELFDIYLDSDVGDTIIQLKSIDSSVENGLKYIGDSDLYNATSANRAREADGNLLDGFNPICTDWLQLPNDIVGGDNWDVQGKARLGKAVYNLEDDVVWNWESDEFPIYGLIQTEPTWDLHLFDPIHYRIPEKWKKISGTQYTFDLDISYLGVNAKYFNFGEHLPFLLLNENEPFATLVNASITYSNGSSIPYTTELSTQFGEIILLIENVSMSKADNNFTITATTYDFTNRSVIALEGIESKTGTFRLNIDCPPIGKTGGTLKCSILAQVEDPQAVEKEVDFTCYILDGERKISSINFNKMITRTPSLFVKEFNIPRTFSDNSEHTVTCEAGYYNLGSRIDTFSDSFIADKHSFPSNFIEFLEDRGGIIAVVLITGFLIFIIFTRDIITYWRIKD